MHTIATRPEAPDTTAALRLLEIWRAACNSTARDSFAGLEDRVHVEVLAILSEHGVVPTVEQQRTLRWLARWEVTTVINMVELIVSGREVRS